MTKPKITLVYICPIESCGAVYFEYARRFASTYQLFPPEMENEIIVVSNGGPPSEQTRALFSPIPNCSLVANDNLGLDIGAFQKFAGLVKCDLMLCLGASIHFHKSGWLKRMVEAWQEKGPGVYGTLCSYETSPHIRPSFMMLDPKLFQAYPYQIKNRKDCLAFESGGWRRKMNFTAWSEGQGFPNWMVTWESVYGIRQWDDPDNVFRKGNQLSTLALDHHSDEFNSADSNKKRFLYQIAYSTKTRSFVLQCIARLFWRIKYFAGKLLGIAKD